MQEVKTLQQSDHQCAQRQRHDAAQVPGGKEHAGAHEQKQHDDLTGRDLCEFHCGFFLLRCI